MAPDIIISVTEHEQLTRLAEAFSTRNATVSGQLLAELDRASVVPDAELPADVVRMGTTLRFRSGSGEDRTVTLVYPGEADIEAGRISIMTPIGVALIGLAAGQSISWTSRDGRTHRLTVEHILEGAKEPSLTV